MNVANVSRALCFVLDAELPALMGPERGSTCGPIAIRRSCSALCKGGLLRMLQTTQQFKSMQAVPGQTSPIMTYFVTLLDYGKLNAMESVELVRPVVQQQKGGLHREVAQRGQVGVHR